MKLKYYNLLVGALLLASCDKTIEMPAPTFDVSTASTTYKAGEDVKFKIQGGDAHIISFYSGELLNDYNSREGRVVDVSKAGATVQFSSSVQVGTQANQVSILVSTDFNGDYSSLAKVKAATWTDVTSKFPLGTNASFRATGAVDLAGIAVPGKPVYFAIKYVTKPQATNGLARQWYFQNFQITSKDKLENTIPLVITDQASAGFRIIDEFPKDAPARASVTATRVTMYGNEYLHAGLPQFDPKNPIFDPLNPQFDPYSPSYSPTLKLQKFVPFDPKSPFNDPLAEHWAVSRAITIDKVDFGPDRAVGLKGISNPVLTEHTHSYSKPGTYKAVFIASNNSIDNEKKVIKEITLTITP